MFSKLSLTEKRELHEMLLDLQEWWDNLTVIQGVTIESCPRLGVQLSSGTYFLLSDEYSLEEYVWSLTQELANQPKPLTNDEFMAALHKAYDSAWVSGEDDGGDALETLLECGRLTNEQALAARAVMIAWGEGLL